MRDNMIIKLGIAVCSLCILTFPVKAAPGRGPLPQSPQSNLGGGGMLIAGDADASSGNSQKKVKKDAQGRRKILTGEASYKNGRRGQKTAINFDEAQIDAARKTPTGVAISKNRPDQEFDLINLRLSWHPEMKESTTRLETGMGK